MQEVTLSLKEYDNLLKDSDDLVIVSLRNDYLQRQLNTANEHINNLDDTIKHYKDLWRSAEKRADKRLEEYRDERITRTRITKLWARRKI